jgi:hypothetical protein
MAKLTAGLKWAPEMPWKTAAAPAYAQNATIPRYTGERLVRVIQQVAAMIVKTTKYVPTNSVSILSHFLLEK